MEKFGQALSEYKLGKRITSELSLLALLIAILFFFVGLNVVYMTATLLMYTLMLLLKRNRIVYQVEFSDTDSEMQILYYYIIFFKGKEKIPYSKLDYKLGLKRFGFGSAIETLEIMNGKFLTAEIRKEGKWKWDEKQMSLLVEKLQKLKDSK